MPTISRFFGIVIFMNYNDHPLPHFHGRYQDQEVTVEIETGLVQGRMSRRALRMILEWSEKYQQELMNNWNRVSAVRDVKGFELSLEFSNGSVKRVDLSNELYGEVFEPLKDPQFFSRVQVNPETGTIEWPNGADFAPEFLYEIGREIKQVA